MSGDVSIGERASERERDYAIALGALQDAVLIEDADRIVVFANDAFGRRFLGDAPGTAFIGVDCAASARQAAEAFVEVSTWLETTERIVRDRLPVRGETWQLVDGTWLERDYVPRFEQGRFVGHSWVYRDVTERERLRARVSDLASELAATAAKPASFHTERATLSDVLDQQPTSATLAYAKVENLSLINLETGRATGDAVLAAIPQRVTAAIPGAWIGRVSGATFAVVPPLGDEPESTAWRLREAIGSITEAEGHPVLLRVSIGAAGGRGDDSLQLRTRARMALGEAQRTGIDQVFDEMLAERQRRNDQLGLALPSAIRGGELSLVFQPVATLADRVVRGHESLVRWERPGFGNLTAASFVPIAERLGVAHELDSWVLRAATALTPRVLAAFGGQQVGFNVSGQTLNDRRGLPQEVAAAIEAAGIEPGNVVVELTETAAAAHTASGIAALRELSDMGVRVAIDDFGVGSSSLALISEMPFDYLKLDKSFTRGIADSRVRALVTRTVAIAADFGASITAEGIERPIEAEALEECGVTAGQGWLIGVPVPPPSAVPTDS